MLDIISDFHKCTVLTFTLTKRGFSGVDDVAIVKKENQ